MKQPKLPFRPSVSRRLAGALALGAMISVSPVVSAHPGHDHDHESAAEPAAREATAPKSNPKLTSATRDTVLTVVAFPFRVISALVTGGESAGTRPAPARAAQEEMTEEPQAGRKSLGRGIGDGLRNVDERIGAPKSNRTKSDEAYANLINGATDALKAVVSLPFKAITYATTVREETKAEGAEMKGGRSSHAVSKTSDYLGGAATGVVDETGDATEAIVTGILDAAKATVGALVKISGTALDTARRGGPADDAAKSDMSEQEHEDAQAGDGM